MSVAAATERVEMVSVPGARDMEDETFWKHINARHLGDFGEDTKPFGVSRLWSPTIALAYRAFHERVHRLMLVGTHDHEHIGEN
jgi:hypothetical protein